MSVTAETTQESARNRPLATWSNRQRLLVAASLGLIILLGAFLRFYQLGAYSIGNAYYAATVQSMLTSWHNFFFAAFEPGGSVTVDKPPLGFWVQAISAAILGVNGFALALPNALAGVLSIPLLYRLVRRPFGAGAALIAALALAVTPVTVSTERNNTIDGLLVFVLLLAAWAFLQAVYSGRARYVYLGALLVGLGFNIKMLQAIMPLPAFYALYMFGAPLRIWKRLFHLAAASVLLVMVSLSWAVAVDLTPTSERPYIGSSSDNTVMELIIGHNGLSRLGLNYLLRQDRPVANSQDGRNPATAANGQPGISQPQPPFAGQTGAGQAGGQPGQFAPQANLPRQPGFQAQPRPQQFPPPGAGPFAPGEQAGDLSPQGGIAPGMIPGAPVTGGQPVQPPAQGSQPPVAGQPGPGGNQNHPGPGFSQEVGQAGWARLFTEPLADEASWLLPLALLGIPLILFQCGWPRPLNEQHLGLLLWAGWLLPAVIYFSFTTGLFHAYYLIMLGPPLAALAGMSTWATWRTIRQHRWTGWAIALLLFGGTLAFQVYTMHNYGAAAGWISILAILVGIAGALLLPWRPGSWLAKAALALVCASLLLAPLAWSGASAFNTGADVWLPHSSPVGTRPDGPQGGEIISARQQKILYYVQANNSSEKYLLAALNARQVAPYILATSLPALSFGGFSGHDDVVTPQSFHELVASGELRFVLADPSLANSKPGIFRQVMTQCKAVSIPGASDPLVLQRPQLNGPNGPAPGQFQPQAGGQLPVQGSQRTAGPVQGQPGQSMQPDQPGQPRAPGGPVNPPGGPDDSKMVLYDCGG